MANFNEEIRKVIENVIFVGYFCLPYIFDLATFLNWPNSAVN